MTITLTGTNAGGQSVDKTVVTGAGGTFSFTGLAAGTSYTLTASNFPTDLVQGVASLGTGNTSGGTASGESITGINLSAATTQSGFNFSVLGVAAKFVSINNFMGLQAVTNSDGTQSVVPLDQAVTYQLNPEPMVSGPTDTQTIPENTSTAALPITLADPLASTSSLTLTGSSSNSTVVPAANIVYGGSGDDRTITGDARRRPTRHRHDHDHRHRSVRQRGDPRLSADRDGQFRQLQRGHPVDRERHRTIARAASGNSSSSVSSSSATSSSTDSSSSLASVSPGLDGQIGRRSGHVRRGHLDLTPAGPSAAAG